VPLNKQALPKKWKQINLNNKIRVLEYKECIDAKIATKTKEDGIDKDWDDIKNSIIETAEETIGKETKRNKNDWWNTGCEEMLKQKNKTKLR
jgi:hypothetical protein